MFNKQTKECFCYHEPPEREDLSYLDVDECEQRSKSFQDSCYMPYAESRGDERYCKKVSMMNRKTCYEKVAHSKNSASICDNIWDDEKCLAGVDLDASEKYLGQTLTDSDIILNSEDVCVVPSNIICLMGVASYNNDPTLCDEIDDQYEKNICNQYFYGEFMFREHKSNDDSYLAELNENIADFGIRCENTCKESNLVFREHDVRYEGESPSVGGYQTSRQYDSNSEFHWEKWSACYCY